MMRLPTRCVLLGIFVVVVGACGDERPPSPVTTPAAGETRSTRELVRGVRPDGPVVLFLGDSLSAGFGLSPEDAFPAVLQRKSTAAGLPFRLVNAGVDGDTTSGGVSRLDWLLRQRPRILVLELGANDALRGQPLEGIEANLRTIIERARSSGCRILLLGMRIPPSYGPEYTEGFAAIYERLGSLDGVELVSFFMNGVAGIPELNLADGIHPTARGHELLAENVFPTLLSLVREMSGESPQRRAAQ